MPYRLIAETDTRSVGDSHPSFYTQVLTITAVLLIRAASWTIFLNFNASIYTHESDLLVNVAIFYSVL